MMVVYIVIHVCIFGDLNCLSKANLKSTLKGDESSFLLSMPENMKTRGFSNFSEAFLFFWVKDSRKTMEWGSQPKLQLPRELLASLQPALSKGFFTSQARRVRWNTDAWWRIGRSVFHCAGAAGNEEVKSDGVISSASLVSSKATNFHHFTPSVPLLQTALLSKTMRLCNEVLTSCWQKCCHSLMKSPKQGGGKSVNACSQACRGELFLLIEEWVRIAPRSS